MKPKPEAGFAQPQAIPRRRVKEIDTEAVSKSQGLYRGRVGYLPVKVTKRCTSLPEDSHRNTAATRRATKGSQFGVCTTISGDGRSRTYFRGAGQRQS